MSDDGMAAAVKVGAAPADRMQSPHRADAWRGWPNACG
jgi:hypothetical protein